MKRFAPILILVLATVLWSGCKKEDLVDPTTNDIEDITTQEQMDAKIASGVSLIFYHASWCTLCKEQRPAVEAVSEDAANAEVGFGEIEYDEHKDIVKSKNINGFPTIVIYVDGKEHIRFDGKGHSQAQIQQGIDSARD